jgi:hypothetical protein
MKILLFLIIIYFQDTKKPNEVYKSGKVHGTEYENDYLNFKIRFHKDWKIEAEEQLNEITNQSKERLSSKSEKAKQTMDYSEQYRASLLFASKYGFGAEVEFNPIFYLAIDYVDHIKEIRNGIDYIKHSDKSNEDLQIETYSLEGIREINIGGKDFFVQETPSYNLEFTTIMYVTIIKGYALMFTVAYKTSNERDEINSIINTISLSNK